MLPGVIAGCSTALHLAERGLSVVLLEAQRIGWGASGRSGAQALFGIAAGQAKLERLIGATDARRIWDITVEGLQLQRELISRYRIDCDYVAGQMQVALKPRQQAELRAEVDTLHERYGYTSIRAAPHMVVIAGLPLVLSTLGFTFLGEGLRDALDPRLRRRVAG